MNYLYSYREIINYIKERDISFVLSEGVATESMLVQYL